MRTSKNILKHELIGLEVTVAEATNLSLVGIHGKIVDETKFVIAVQTDKGERKILKKGVKIEIVLDDGNVIVTGEKLVGRPEDRIKK